MNTSINAKSPNFKAYKCADLKEFRTLLNKLSISERNALAKQITKAKQKLADTKYADVVTFVQEGKICHHCKKKTPIMREDGTIDFIQATGINWDTLKLKSAIKQALKWEKEGKKDVESLDNFKTLI